MIILLPAVLLLILLISYWASPKMTKPVSYLPFDKDKRYVKPGNWKGTPVDKKGRFMNAEHPFFQNYLKILIWIPGHAINLLRNRKLRFRVESHKSGKVLEINETLIWLGHASFFMRINNKNFLIDPQFNNTVFYKRHTPNPIPKELFRNIDYILVSHDHADHCDKGSLRLLFSNNPGVTVISGLNMNELLQSFESKKIKIKTMDWYEEISLDDEMKLYFVPARHYSKRIFNKFNKRLWGGFVIRYKHSSGKIQTIFYGGDSGYDHHFNDIRELFLPDIAILPIGTYKPRWFMQPNHMSVEDALQAFRDSGAEVMIPMHYGTFNLSNENMRTPIETLNESADSSKIILLKAGELKVF